jgi:hypothetical protein
VRERSRRAAHCGATLRGMASLGALWVVSGSLLGCTSIRWQDDDGTTHHLGLVAGRLERSDRGERLERFAVGLDVRLSGEDAGASVGLIHGSPVAPRTIKMSDPNDMLASVAAHLRGEEAPALPRLVEWSFFYFEEPVTSAQTVHLARTLGFEFIAGGPGAGMGLGYRQTSAIVGAALDGRSVQIASQHAGAPETWDLTLWSLEAHDRGQAIAKNSQEGVTR